MNILLILFVLFIPVILIVLWIIGTYNSLVKLRVQGDAAWSDVDVQLKRRHDLIPNIVETVKGYAAHERQTFQQVVEARGKAMGASSPAERAQAENMLTQALRQLFALAEAYPELKANQNFLDLQNTLNEIEEYIQNARRYYNAVVRDYNSKVLMFPSSLIASMFNFRQRDFFLIEEGEREPVAVRF